MPVLLPLLDALLQYASPAERDIFLVGHDEMPGPPCPVYTVMLPDGGNFIATHATDSGDPIGVTMSDDDIGRCLNPLTGNNTNFRKIQTVVGILLRLGHDPAVRFFGILAGDGLPARTEILPELVRTASVSWHVHDEARLTCTLGGRRFCFHHVLVELPDIKPSQFARRDDDIIRQRALKASELAQTQSLPLEAAARRAIEEIPNPFRDRTEPKSAVRRVTRTVRRLGLLKPKPSRQGQTNQSEKDSLARGR